MSPPRVSLVQLPTPVHRLDRLSDTLGIDLWIKRDDLTGLALGGNKGRKLEYLMAEAVGIGAQAVVTCGAAQSNFIRQLAAACSMFGIRCVAAVMNLPYNAESGVPDEDGLSDQGGNLLLDQLFGAELRRFENDDWSVLYDRAESIATDLEARSTNVYRIPVGGSSALGGYAFYEAAAEVAAQADPFDVVVTSTSSGSTQAGLGYALRDSRSRLIGIAADPEPDLVEDVLRVGKGLSDLLGLPKLGERDFEVRIEWAGSAYGVPSVAGNDAIELMARTEGILLDPIYTGKAFAGLIDLAKSREIKGRILFWHTGGVPALFAACGQSLPL